jgi:hypothetical protein
LLEGVALGIELEDVVLDLVVKIRFGGHQGHAVVVAAAGELETVQAAQDAKEDLVFFALLVSPAHCGTYRHRYYYSHSLSQSSDRSEMRAYQELLRQQLLSSPRRARISSP